MPLGQILSETPLNHTGIWACNVYPIGIAFAFLVPADVSLSLWVFFLFTCAEMQISHWMGRPIGAGGPSGSFMAWQEAGAYIVFAAMMLWAARRPLADVVRKAFGRREVDDSQEPIGHRLAFWGFVFSFVAMSVWLALHKMGPLVSVIFVTLSFVIVIGVARLVTQGGVFFVLQRYLVSGLAAGGVGRSIDNGVSSRSSGNSSSADG